VNAPWTLDFCNELENFTGNGKDHDDQVDAAVNTFNELSTVGVAWA
jgi:predicted phage terminase large subunit-like protein